MRIIPILALLLFILPSASFAAALTQQQSSSLIAVVQSSPGTPASAVISLITAFSNITVTQATSLITVVQAAPSVPADAFVDLLTSFTEDAPVAQSVTPTTTSPDVCTNIEGIQTTVPGGMAATGNVCIAIQVNSPTTTTNVVQSPIVSELRIIKNPSTNSEGDVFYDLYVFYKESDKDGDKNVIGTPITISSPTGEFTANGKFVSLTATSIIRGRIGTQGEPGVLFQYMPQTPGVKTLTFTAKDVTKTLDVAGNDQ